jgi:N-acetylmuramoyl-L-alanine amidase
MYPELLNDIGHGKNTYPPSKGVPGLPEFEFNNAVGKEVKRLLSGKVPTYEAQPFNRNDVPLGTRTLLYNARYSKNRAAIGISDHANANGNPAVRGFGVFYWHSSPEAKKLAEILLDEYKKEFPGYPIWGTGLFPSKPDTWTDLHMCRETSANFVLVEWEFMTNPEGLKLLKSNDYRKRCALVKAMAVCRWYGINGPTINTPEQQKLKEEEDMLEKAVVIYGEADYPTGKRLAARLGGAPVFARSDVTSKKVAKELYVVGGDAKGMVADKVVLLSGDDYFATVAAVMKFLG